MQVKDILIRQKDNEDIAICYKGERITYKGLYLKAAEISSKLKKISHNKNVGIFFNNSIDYAIGYFSVAFMDHVIIPIENNIGQEMVLGIIKYCEISLILTNSENYNTLKVFLQESDYGVTVYCVDSDALFVPEEKAAIQQQDHDLDDVFIMLHTSGTTSDPKKVMLTNRSLIANVESNIASLGLKKEDVCLIVLPMFFGYCNSSQFLSHIYLGAKLIIYDGVFIPRKFLSFIDNEKCTNTTCVPSMLILTVSSVSRERYNLSSLRYLCFGGGIMPVEQLNKIIGFFNYAGVVQTYGQTEASPRVTCLLPEDAVRKMGSVGKAIPGVRVSVVDEKDQPVKPGESGEIVVQGSNVMKGYFKKNEITRRTLRNGWLHTGDIGRFDDEGYLYVVGRIKNIIISGGLNIYPEEIEEVLINNNKVKEALVCGERHEVLGEIPVAKIVLKDGEHSSQSEIIEYCLSKLSPNKVPSRIEFCDSLEKTYTGKIKRKKG